MANSAMAMALGTVCPPIIRALRQGVLSDKSSVEQCNGHGEDTLPMAIARPQIDHLQKGEEKHQEAEEERESERERGSQRGRERERKVGG